MGLKTVRCMYRKAVVALLLALSALAFATSTPAGDVDFALAFSDETTADSIAQAALREEEGEDFSSLFYDADSIMQVDTLFAWSNDRINSGRFDYRTLGPGDTIKIPLVDSAHGKFYVHPIKNYVTSRFGLRRYMWHYGIDVKLATGDTLRSALDGIVRVIQFDRRGYGNVAVVRHHNGLETVYGHMSRVLVQPNQHIKAGEAVGLGGNTGRSTGAHLHFEIRYCGEPFNPEYIIDFDNTYALKRDTLMLTRDNFEYLTEVRKTVYYVVRRGDNLGSIARRHGTTAVNLCRLNGITTRTPLKVGRRLIIRSGKEAEKQVVSASVPTPPMNAQAPADTHADDAAGIGGPEIDMGEDDE
ncbi:MAG: M23 family metallopeptidase [Chitinispirillia bacterium]|nr:M23 family metallopeptidase [Chitinispirillia bacterium]MCL2267794.1 M23 family metallopeptidase [Chitinispirillia bacterium]